MLPDGRPHSAGERLCWWMDYASDPAELPADWLMHFDRYYNEVNGIVGKWAHQKKKQKEKKKKMANNECCAVYPVMLNNQWVTSTFAGSQQKIAVCCKQEEDQEEEVTMNTFEQDTRDYLTKRVANTNTTLEGKTCDQFHIGESGMPKTYKQLIDAIQNNRFTLDEQITKHIDACPEDYCYSALDPIIFTDFPKPDYDGRATALQELKKAKIAVLDIVMTGTSVEALAAIKTFESWVPANLPAN